MVEEKLKDFVEASVTYTVPGEEKPSTSTVGPGGRLREIKGNYQPQTVKLYDARPATGELSLDHNGFVFLNKPTQVNNFWDSKQVTTTYYTETEALIKQVTGAQDVLIFDHTLRSQDLKQQEENYARQPVSMVHNDYTAWSGGQRVRDLLPEDEAEARLQKRVSIIQVWRPIRGPVEAWPLAFCLPQSVEDKDLIASERRHPNRVGEIYLLAENSEHKWVYFPNMTVDEVLVFRCYESMTDGRVRFTAHTSFEDPTTPKGAAPRESIEIRALAFFA